MTLRPKSFLVLCCMLVMAGWGLLSETNAAPTHEWTTFNSRGLAVEYPRDVFTEAGVGEHDGRLFTTRDKRARLTIFTLSNERGATPAQFLRRSFPENRRNLTYDRVASNFFAVSEPKNGLILYRRCNFSTGAMIHCIDLQYPRREKRAWDAIVTRISLSLRPR
jgi:hypothetical protein